MSVMRGDALTVAVPSLSDRWPDRVILVGLAALLLLPWSAALKIAAGPGPLATAFLTTPVYLYTVVAVAIFGLLMMRGCAPAGAAIVYAGASCLLTQTDLALACAHWLAIGVGLVLLLSLEDLRHWARIGLMVSIVLQIGYALIQLTHRDLFFFGLHPATVITPAGARLWVIPPMGSIGNEKYFGAMLALAGAVAPPWLVVLPAFGVWLTKSTLAAAALAVGLIVRMRSWTVALAVTVFGGWVYVWREGHDAGVGGSILSRLDAWGLALRDLFHAPLMGRGMGAWFTRIPELQKAADPTGAPIEVYYNSHSDVLQWAYEGGLIGVGILVWFLLWLWRRGAFHGPWGGALAALGVLVIALHPFHVPTLAPTCLLVIACSISSSSSAS